MDGPNSIQHIQSSDAVGRLLRQQGTVNAAERQNRITELRRQIQTGEYQIDLRGLSERIYSSGVLERNE
ncbi:hypothetical protein GCM10010885_20880 [Alicyclobacillus cellulosilyticus]|uniref:Anti-sigma-28 factor FlgM C-terminal domain-containing protein n=1 Tax=Alicyclobacillus cellulosilyticus TaxID=1003997 RepID=A0A917KFJ2_9BACL|nr:hypothetical protein GCM10010885_20880 [Alicyclobacillus cellulosilyticus]